MTVRVNTNLLALIRGVMAARRLRQKDFCERYNMSKQYFSQMLSGKERWREEILEQLLSDLELTDKIKKLGLY